MEDNREVIVNNTHISNLFQEYLTLKKPILEAILSRINNKRIHLAPKILNVFALLLYYNYIYRDMEESEKWNRVFSYSTKQMIMKQLDINDSHLNTYISMLRSIKLLSGKQISLPFIFYPESGFELTFKFIFKDEK